MNEWRIAGYCGIVGIVRPAGWLSIKRVEDDALPEENVNDDVVYILSLTQEKAVEERRSVK